MNAVVSLIYWDVIAAGITRFGFDIVVANAGNGCRHGSVWETNKR